MRCDERICRRQILRLPNSGLLCLLTLLIRGGRSAWFTGTNSYEGKLRFDNQMYRLASKNMAVAIAFIIYAAVLIGSMVTGKA